MIKPFVAAALAAAALTLGSCASAPVVIADHGPVALVSVVSNTSVPWLDPDDEDADDGNGLLSSMVNGLVDGGNPERLTGAERAERAEERFREVLAEVGGVEVLDREAVVKSRAYGRIGASLYNSLSSTVVPEGYKDLTTLGSKDARLLMEETGARSLVILQLSFHKRLERGNRWNGSLRGGVTMKVRVLGSDGGEISSGTVVGLTSGALEVSGRKYDRDALVEMLPGAAEDAARAFVVTRLLGE